MTSISKEGRDFKSIEREIFETMCRVACGMIRQYLEWRDKSIMALRDTKKYRMIDIRETTIKTVMGEVRYKRRYYKRRTGGYVFLLDEAMGMDKRYGLVSDNLAEQIVVECTEKSFSKAAASISSNTGQRISRMGAWGVVQQYGYAIKEQEMRLQELYDSGSKGHLGNKSRPVIFEEFDDVWISRQHDTRRKKGEILRGKKKRPKMGKKPMHVGMAYTGWEQIGDKRHRTTDKIAYASFGSSSAFITTFETLLHNVFDMDGVVRRITNGDGESWIRTSSETKDTILQLDSYHRNERVVKSVSEKTDKREIFKAIRAKDVDKAISAISELVFEAEDEKTIKKLIDLYNYFNNNRDILLTWSARGIELPKPPDGITYRNMGVMESNNNCLITQRMKHRKGSWTKSGANNMAKILCLRNTIGFDSILGSLPEPEESDYCVEPLSASKSPEYDGKGYGADWLYAQMPFEQAFKTHGREAIRNMLRMKPLTEVPFILAPGVGKSCFPNN
jgi:hypothetical protein